MAENIKGITVQIGGDVSGLQKALKDVNKDLNSNQRELNKLNKLLKLDPKNTDLLRQKQELLADSIEKTSDKIQALKDAKEKADIDMANGTEVNQEQYRLLVREIASSEQSLANLQSQADDTNTAIGNIEAESLKELEKQAGKSKISLEDVEKAAEKVGDAADKVYEKTKALSAAAGAGLAALGGMAVSAVKNADDLNTLAKQTGFSTEELQKFQYASDLVDVSVEDITGSIKKLRKSMGSDTDAVAEAFSKIGVSVKDSSGNLRDSEEVFYEVLEGLSKITNDTERDVVAMELFGKSADNLAGIVDDGGKALKELGQQAEDLGLILDQDTLDALNETNDKIDTLKANATATMAEIGAKAADVLAPAIEDILNMAQKLFSWLGKLDTKVVKATAIILAVTASIAPLAKGIKGVSDAIKGISTAVDFIKTTVFPMIEQGVAWLLANPIALVIAAIVALVVLIATKGDEIQAALQRVDDFLQNIFAKDFTEILGPVLGGVLNAFLDVVKSVWDGVKSVFDGMIDFIRGTFTGNWERAWNGVKEIFSGIFGALVGIAKAPINGIIDLLNFAIGGINSFIGMANRVLGRFGVSVGTIGNIPYLANGGILSSGSAIVGEAGPELLTMSNGRAVVQPLTTNTQNIEGLLGDISGKLGNGGDVTIVVKSVLDGKVIGESVTQYQRRRSAAYG